MKITGTIWENPDAVQEIDLEVTFSPDEWRNLYAGLAIATHLNDGSPDKAAHYARGMGEALVAALADTNREPNRLTPRASND